MGWIILKIIWENIEGLKFCPNHRVCYIEGRGLLPVDTYYYRWGLLFWEMGGRFNSVSHTEILYGQTKNYKKDWRGIFKNCTNTFLILSLSSLNTEQALFIRLILNNRSFLVRSKVVKLSCSGELEMIGAITAPWV